MSTSGNGFVSARSGKLNVTQWTMLSMMNGHRVVSIRQRRWRFDRLSVTHILVALRQAQGDR